MNNLATSIQTLVLWSIPILFAITLHEVAHGWAASRLGDKTALMLGRLTLNPIKHIDPIGTIVIPITFFFLSGFIFGWAKPVPITQDNLGSKRRDMALIALAGPMANLVMALFWGIIIKASLMIAHQYPQINPKALAALVYMGQAGIMINLVLAILNLLPILPLDGGRIVNNLLPLKLSVRHERSEPYGLVLLIVLLVSGGLHYFLLPPVHFLYTLFNYLLGISPSI